MSDVTHACPVGDEACTPCGIWPAEDLGEMMTIKIDRVTCLPCLIAITKEDSAKITALKAEVDLGKAMYGRAMVVFAEERDKLQAEVDRLRREKQGKLEQSEDYRIAWERGRAAEAQVAALKAEVEFHRAALVRVAQAAGCESPLQLTVLATKDEQSYADLLVIHVERMARAAEARGLERAVEMHRHQVVITCPEDCWCWKADEEAAAKLKEVAREA